MYRLLPGSPFIPKRYYHHAKVDGIAIHFIIRVFTYLSNLFPYGNHPRIRLADSFAFSYIFSGESSRKNSPF